MRERERTSSLINIILLIISADDHYRKVYGGATAERTSPVSNIINELDTPSSGILYFEDELSQSYFRLLFFYTGLNFHPHDRANFHRLPGLFVEKKRKKKKVTPERKPINKAST